MNKTKIEWLNGGYTWNPVTGCYHNCEYCYARKIASRFVSDIRVDDISKIIRKDMSVGPCIEMENRLGQYPHGFLPTFHRYRLDEPQKIKKPQNIFVCSMADLFGDWIPDEWIQKVFEACEQAPQHRYFFLTKNPKRYYDLELPIKDNFWFGTTLTTNCYMYYYSDVRNSFLSLEPLDTIYVPDINYLVDWVIMGAETGNRKNKVKPSKEIISMNIDNCKLYNIPIFMKNNLKEIWGDELLQEFPFERSKDDTETA